MSKAEIMVGEELVQNEAFSRKMLDRVAFELQSLCSCCLGLCAALDGQQA